MSQKQYQREKHHRRNDLNYDPLRLKTLQSSIYRRRYNSTKTRYTIGHWCKNCLSVGDSCRCVKISWHIKSTFLLSLFARSARIFNVTTQLSLLTPDYT